MKRDGTVGVPAILAAKRQEHFAGAEQLREVVRGKADTALGQIESELEPHRAAEPGVGAALRRPRAFDQIRRARRGRCRSAALRAGRGYEPAGPGARRAAGQRAGQRRREQLDIVGRRHRQTRRRRTGGKLVEDVRELRPIRPNERHLLAIVLRKCRKHFAMPLGKIAQWQRRRAGCLQRSPAPRRAWRQGSRASPIWPSLRSLRGSDGCRLSLTARNVLSARASPAVPRLGRGPRSTARSRMSMACR